MKQWIEKNWKRILSVVMVVALASGLHAYISKADTAPVEITGLRLTTNAQKNSSQKAIYAIFEAEDLSGLTINGWNNRFKPADAKSGIFVNGSTTAAACPSQGGYAYQNALGKGIYLENFGSLNVGEYLIVKGSFVSESTGEKFVLSNAMRFTWKGDTDKWEVSYEGKEAINIESLTLSSAAQTASNKNGIYTVFEAEDLSGLTVNAWNNRFKPADAESGIFVNGNTTAAAYPSQGGYAYQAALGNSHKGIYLEQFGTLEVDDYLTVKGTFISESTGEKFTLRNAMRFTWKGDTDKWVVSYEADAIPTDVTFEDLASTKQANLVEVASGEIGTLGTLADVANGFKFKISSIVKADTEDEAVKDLKIALYNPTTNIWGGGYHLRLRRDTTQGLVKWAIIDQAGNKQLASGKITDATETLEVYAWISDVTTSGHTLNLNVNNKCVLAKQMDDSVVLGTNLQVYNGWNTTMTVHTFDQDITTPDEPDTPDVPDIPDEPDEPDTPDVPDIPDEPDTPGVTIPTDVIFEDLAKTKAANTVEVASGATGELGTLTDVAKGFKFKISSIGVADAGKDFKISLYNAETSIWKGGYHLRLIPEETQGVVKWAIIDQAGNKQLASGKLTEVPETMEVYAWISDVTTTGHTLNIIADGQQILSKEMDGSVDVGTNLQAYNGWNSTVTIHTFEQYDGNPEDNDTNNTPTNVSIPTNVTFEDLAKTLKMNTAEVASKKEGTLGTLTDVTKGFKFKLSGIDAKNAGKDLKIALYNPETSMWKGGYHLRLIPGTTQGTVQWAIIGAKAGKQLASGTLTGVSETMEVYAWVSDVTSSGHTLNIIANGQGILSKKMDGSVTLGTNLYVYNGWDSTATIHTYSQYVKEPVKIPANVTFEDLAKTIRMDMVEVASKKEGTLGTLTDVAHGFKVKLSSITTANAGKDLKIALYNPEASMWKGGYHLRLIPGVKQGVVDWAIINPVKNKQLASGSIADVPDTMEIYAWVSDVTSSGHTLNIIADGQLIFSKAMGSGVKLGTNLYAYNGWGDTAVFYTYDKYVKVAAKLPSNVIFEDLSKTAQVNSVEMASKKEGSLGTLSDVTRGFKFKLSSVGLKNAGTEIKIGLYNPTNSPWKGGYFLRLIPGTKEGVVDWAIINAAKDKQLASGAMANVPETLEVYAWVSNITSSGHTLNIIADGQLIFSKKMDGSVELGKKLFVYNGWLNPALFQTFEQVVRVKATIPTDIKFEDIGSAMLKKQVEVPSKTNVTLSILESENNGFQFIMSTPEGTDYGRSMKVGLYNRNNYPWAEGYILQVRPNSDGTIYFALLKGRTEEVCAVVPAFTDVKHGENFKITVWISSDVTNPGAHTMHVVLNDIELITYTCEDGSVMLGKHMTVYSEWAKTTAILAVTDTETLEERYLRIFGDPTAMTEGTNMGNNNSNQIAGASKNQAWLYMLIGATTGALVTIGVFAVFVLKKRKKESQEQ